MQNCKADGNSEYFERNPFMLVKLVEKTTSNERVKDITHFYSFLLSLGSVFRVAPVMVQLPKLKEKPYLFFFFKTWENETLWFK